LVSDFIYELLCNYIIYFIISGDVEDYFDEDNLDKDPTTTASSSAI